MTPFRVITCVVLLLLIGCDQSVDKQKVKIALNPWPGYEYIYLAEQKGFFADQGLNIEVVEMSSLADVQRVYIQGRVDAFASTLIEVVQVVGSLDASVTVFHIADFSNGGDIIMANDSIKDVKALKGKRVGAEIGSLGMYILALALDKNGLSLSDVDVVNVEQLDAKESMASNKVDAMVTYPPFSTNIIELGNMKVLFSTEELPGDVIDTVTINSELMSTLPDDWLKRFSMAWDRALSYAEANPDDAHKIMAEREGLSVEEFRDALTGLTVLTFVESEKAKRSPKTKANLKKVCQTLKFAGSKDLDCPKIESLILFE